MEINDVRSAVSQLLEVPSPWFIERIDFQKGSQVVDIFMDFKKGSRFRCSECDSDCSVYDKAVRRWRYLDWFDYRCYLNVSVPRTNCRVDGIRTINATPWGRMGTHYSYVFEQLVMRWSAQMAMAAISRELGEPDSNLWRVFNHYVGDAVNNQLDLSHVRRIAVDEKSQKKGHTYVTIFTDLDAGNVILVKEGRKKEVFEDLHNWLIEKGGLPKDIELFSMDMSTSYKAGRADHFPESEVVFDHFHVKKALNEAVDSVRKEEVKHSDDLKKTKYIWLKNRTRLTDIQERKLNNFLQESSLNTAIAYQMKTAFDQLWKVQPYAIESLLDNWLQNALISKLKPFSNFVTTVKNHYKGIVTAIKTGINNAIAEGINSKVQVAKSRARGFRNVNNFIAMIYFIGNNFIFDSFDS